MKIAIIGTNGFLSATIAKYAIERGWSLDMYGLDKPIHHTYCHFERENMCLAVAENRT